MGWKRDRDVRVLTRYVCVCVFIGGNCCFSGVEYMLTPYSPLGQYEGVVGTQILSLVCMYVDVRMRK